MKYYFAEEAKNASNTYNRKTFKKELDAVLNSVMSAVDVAAKRGVYGVEVELKEDIAPSIVENVLISYGYTVNFLENTKTFVVSWNG